MWLQMATQTQRKMYISNASKCLKKAQILEQHIQPKIEDICPMFYPI